MPGKAVKKAEKAKMFLQCASWLKVLRILRLWNNIEVVSKLLVYLNSFGRSVSCLKVL
jgi:hypothetical protein